ncbi:MAG: 50S ribosomal protein L10 [Phycisphaerae bacterium]|nr:50S ribosomal protein L10 [Phycisphaerae bacterium]
MSKPVKELLRKELTGRLEGVDSLAVVGFSGVDAPMTHMIRKRLRAKNITMRVVKNSVARQAFQSVGLERVADLLDGPCAIAYAPDGVVGVIRELLELGKDAPTLTVKAAYMEGDVFGAERIAELSKYPTRDEAIALVVSAATGPGRKLAGCLMAPARKLAAVIKVVEDKARASSPAPLPEAA